MHRPHPITIEAGLRPGALGRITSWHGSYYGNTWGLSLAFEAEVARELADFVEAYRPDRDLMLLALRGDRMVGSVAIAGRDWPDQARLRWFIVDPAEMGGGIGGRLLDGALEFCQDKGFAAVSLWTFAGLDAARRLYDQAGFRLTEEECFDGWGRPVVRQHLVLSRDAPARVFSPCASPRL